MEKELAKQIIKAVGKANESSSSDDVNKLVIDAISDYITENTTVTVEYIGKAKRLLPGVIVGPDGTYSLPVTPGTEGSSITTDPLNPINYFEIIEINVEDQAPVTGNIGKVKTGESVPEWLDNLGKKIPVTIKCIEGGEIVSLDEEIDIFTEMKISEYTSVYNASVSEARKLSTSALQEKVWMSIAKGIIKALLDQKPPEKEFSGSISEDYVKEQGYLEVLEGYVKIKKIEIK